MTTPLQINRTLVLGGTGFLGAHVCERLVERNGGGGGPVTVPSRRPQRAGDIRALPTVVVPRADLSDDATLNRLVAEHDAVINLVGVLHGDEAHFRAIHTDLPRRIAAACQAKGVTRLIHVSALGVSPDAPSAYLRSKADGEAVLKEAALELTLLRPSVMFGASDRFINLFASLQRWAPVMPLACQDARFQPVWVEDVAAAIVACLDRRSTIGQTIECAGPAVFTLGELVALAGRWAGHERRQIGLPESLGRLQAGLMELLPGEPLMSRDNLLSMRVPNVASGSLPGLESLGIHPTDIRSVMPAVLGSTSGPGRLDALRAATPRPPGRNV